MSNHLSLPVVISPTRAELGARCHRRHFLSDVLNRASYYSASLEFGSVIHAGAAAYWLNTQKGNLNTWQAAIAEEWQKRFTENPQIDSGDLTVQIAEAMMRYYESNSQLAGPFTEAGPWQLVDVEQRFEIPLNNAKLSFQCDRVVYNADEDWLVVVDSKTAARLDGRWDRQWETSLQMKLYKAGVKTVFGHTGRVDIVVEGLLKHVPSSIRYYVCPDWSNDLLAEAAFNAYTVAALDRDIIEQSMDEVVLAVDARGEPKQVQLSPNVTKAEELAVRFTPVNYADCYSYNVECPFRRLCVADFDERTPILRAEFFETKSEEY